MSIALPTPAGPGPEDPNPSDPSPRTPLSAVPPVTVPDHDADGCDEVLDPRPDQVQAMAVLIFEVIEGLRGITQLGTAITLGAARQLTAMRAARQEQRTVLREPARHVSRAGHVRVDRPSAGVAEAASVVYVGERARAVAMRLEWLHLRWRATEIAVL